jgi:hypothetical protein
MSNKGNLDVGCKVWVRGISPERTGVVLQFLEGERVQLGEAANDPRSIPFPGVYDAARLDPVMEWSSRLEDYRLVRAMNEYGVAEALAKQGVR